MATWYLMNNVWVGTNRKLAGAYIDDSITSTVDILAVGGRLAASSTSGLAAASERATKLRLAGGDEAEMESIMNAALDAAQTAATEAQDTVDAATFTECGMVSFRAPDAPDVVSVVADVLLADGAQVIAKQPNHPCHLQINLTDADSSITAGIATLVGVAQDGTVLNEEFDLTGGSAVLDTADAYAEVTSFTVAGLAGNGAGDNIGVGPSGALALPIPAGATSVAVQKTLVGSVAEATGTLDGTARSIEPTTTPNGTLDFEFWYTYVRSHTHTLS